MPTLLRIFKILTHILEKPKRTAEDIIKISEFLLMIRELSPYIISFSSISLEELASTLKLEKHNDEETIFNKGDKSDKLYLITKGHIWLYDVDSNQNLIHITSLSPGKILGERGLIRNLPRSLTAISKNSTNLITLELDKFTLIINTQLQSNIDEKINFIEKTFPKTVGFRLYQRERMAYCIDVKQYKRDDLVIAETVLCEYLMILFSGECLLLKKASGGKVKISCIEPGCFVAEECIFLDQPSHFYYRVLTDTAKIYFIKKHHFLAQCPPDLLKRLTYMCKVRVGKRDKMAQLAAGVAVLGGNSVKVNRSVLPAIRKVEGEINFRNKALSQTKSELMMLCRRMRTNMNSTGCLETFGLREV